MPQTLVSLAIKASYFSKMWNFHEWWPHCFKKIEGYLKQTLTSLVSFEHRSHPKLVRTFLSALRNWTALCIWKSAKVCLNVWVSDSVTEGSESRESLTSKPSIQLGDIWDVHTHIQEASVLIRVGWKSKNIELVFLSPKIDCYTQK